MADILEQLILLNSQIRLLRLKWTQAGKRKEYLLNNMPADPILANRWCADASEGLSGEVGTIEIPGEYIGPEQLHIRPGYTDGALYNASRDGQLRPAVAGGPWSTFLNKCMLPGWQKFQPLHRYGTIVAGTLDFDNDICDVCLDAANSSQQNLPINQNEGFSNECARSAPAGFLRFCQSNPTHPT